MLIKKYGLDSLILGIGLLLVVFLQLYRAPGVYYPLWSDEVCNNHTYLSSPSSLRELCRTVCYFYKPVIDFAMKKWIWFQIFVPTEAGFALVPWFYAGLTLLFVLLFPWSRFAEVRLLGTMLVGLCQLEYRFSYEAQCYSFSSLLSWLTLLIFGSAFWKLEKGNIRASFWLALSAFGLGLNSHFFAWPYVGLAAVVFMFVFVRFVKKNAPHTVWPLMLFLGMGMVVVVTVILNIYPIISMLFYPPESNEVFRLKWKMAWESHLLHWAWATIPLSFYSVLSLMGLCHPERPKRLLAWVAGLATGPALYFVYMVFTARSSFPMQERYLIAYVAPTLFLAFLGVDAMGVWLYRWNARWGRIAFIAFVGGVFLYLWKSSISKDFKKYRNEIGTGWTALRTRPMNFSPQYDFFERAKAHRRPVLVLSNQCWLLPIPDLYMRYLGSQLPPETVSILNVAGCETSERDLKDGLRSFFEKYNDKGLVLILFEEKGQIPCREPIPVVDQNTFLDEGCHALYESKDIRPWIDRNFNPTLLSSAESSSPPLKPQRFLRKVLAPVVYYLVPLMCIGSFIFVFYFFRLRL
ncbi:MAG: hypothetical protein KCHDKBKB_01081 [Elusimicrobia bacterium]|nr:hypothetical protein [Elusimicrobiota bacterium]